MQLRNTFTVGLPVEQTWRTLLDLERLAPCLPGAAVTEVRGEELHGGVQVKVGPISAEYRGVATLVEADDDARRAVISGEGRDVGGQGTARAAITATLSEQGEGTLVRVDTDLELSGRVAQFGRGVIGDVTGRLLDQFSRNLEAELERGGRPDGSPSSATSPAPDGATSPAPDGVEPLDLLAVLREPLARYALPAAAGALAGLAVGLVLGTRRGRAGDWPVTVVLAPPAGHREEG